MRAQRRVEHAVHEHLLTLRLVLLRLMHGDLLIRFVLSFLSCQHQRASFLVSS